MTYDLWKYVLLGITNTKKNTKRKTFTGIKIIITTIED